MLFLLLLPLLHRVVSSLLLWCSDVIAVSVAVSVPVADVAAG